MKPKRTFRLLITSIGSTGAMCAVKAFYEQKCYSVELFGTDIMNEVAGKSFVKKFFQVPPAKDKNFISVISDIIVSQEIDIVIPINETECEVLSLQREKLNAFLCLSNTPTLKKCFNKISYYKHFNSQIVKTPRQLSFKEAKKGRAIIKPIKGTGGVGIAHFDPSARFNKKLFFIQELLKGVEISVDGYRSFYDQKIFFVPRTRENIKGGLATSSTTLENSENIKEIITTIVEQLNILGPFNIQLKQDIKSQWNLIDINPRFGGAYICSVMAGLDVGTYIINDHLKKTSEVMKYKVNFQMLRFWEEVYYENSSV